MRVTPNASGWLHRALEHEFDAARRFTLYAAAARRAGDAGLAQTLADAAAQELRHAARLADALADAGALGGQAPPAAALRAGAAAIEQRAVAMYRQAARACATLQSVRALFEKLAGEEAAHGARFSMDAAQPGRQA